MEHINFLCAIAFANFLEQKKLLQMFYFFFVILRIFFYLRRIWLYIFSIFDLKPLFTGE